MKVEDSGMPSENYWNSLFDIDGILNWLDVPKQSQVVEIGCGYGSFTLPIARQNPLCEISCFDIEQDMLDCTKAKIEKANLRNVEYHLRDVVINGTDLHSESIDLVLLINLLHSDHNINFLKEAYRILKPGGMVVIIHWRKDIPTPRGPDVELRPDNKQVIREIKDLDFKQFGNDGILEPYHWGMKLIKNHEI